MTGIDDVIGDFPVISYHRAGGADHYVDILFAGSGSISEFMTSQYTGLSVGTIKDADGEMFNNITRN